ncbi:MULTISPECIES: phosphate ABC transporter ATP-binding protein PstB [Haloferax]|uniref:Phosphate ABC transporter ATP-binding protein n=6 Tax=Haloferax TaxID=2251 RepID=L9V6G0_HALVD|nr:MULTISPECIES: phosphate ABC transporter ATP-binding protein PstB [Haloferax]ELK55679.1 phosphate ABC transporter ATP-binding protein [Haloferax sp. BAB-2207]ELY32820.1 phosphate ABC transporter ATP-binding protein [Haloferax volcanii DS2]ELZ76208.1 phosphate ABC transporter ATP-binding protein [Haloferax lucentense DSM 14919]ELZ87067.1 phosphate ABC transporter ATP-binding protein [Haloferax alexandrinus JCM 10717]MBC9987063.1 phosphate ABC transporter ATP-binding protein [Haloferax sp. AS1
MNGTEDPTNDEMLVETDVSDGLSASGNSVSQGVETVISSEDINVWYGDDHALTDITMDIPENSVTAMIGPSGCGKSTFLRCINRMNDLIDVARVEGRLTLRGKNVYDDDVDPVALRRRVGMVFQKPNPFPKSIYENVVYGLKIQGIDADYDAVVEESLKRAALWDEVKDRLHESGLDLSGGQQQRLCIARAIATDPEVLLMDEPASALDPVATSQIEDLVEELAEDYTVVIVTHNMQQAARISDKTAVFLTGGELVEFDDTQKIFENPESQRVEDYITGKFG